MSTIILYTLENKYTGEIRYIGYTTKSLELRLKKHLNNVNEAFNSKTRKINKRLSWIKSLNNEIIIRELDRGTIQDITWMEQFYISLFKTWGFNLTNGTLGGDGGNTFSKLSEENKKICREKLSKAAKGRKNGPLSEEHKEKLKKNHAIKNGKILHPSLNLIPNKETKLKQRNSKLGKKRAYRPSIKHIFNEIQQFDLNNNFIQSFKSIEDVIIYISGITNAIPKSIKANLLRVKNRKQSSAYNFLWTFN